MPSLLDIPDPLLQPDQRDPFVAWLSRQPVPYYTKRELAYRWSRATNTQLTTQDYQTLSDSCPRP
jgi:hypothetical protein